MTTVDTTTADTTPSGPAVGSANTTPGTTTIALRALEHLAACLVREAARVPRRDVSVRLADAGGGLKILVGIPVTVSASSAESIVERTDDLRRHVVSGMRELAGREVRVVDVRWSGVRRIDERRVR